MRIALLASALGMAVLTAAPALALNPQPLPPGMRAPYRNFGPGVTPYSLPWNGGGRIRLPHCHGVQIGDPRTHPPVRVCN